MSQTQINGNVVSGDDGEPIIGATVSLKSTKATLAVTDIDGNFSFTTDQKSPMLEISYIGMKTVTVKGGQNMKVTLYSDAQDAGVEVVVTGMTRTDKRLFTGATTKVDASKAKIDGVADISRSLEGRVAGVSV